MYLFLRISGFWSGFLWLPLCVFFTSFSVPCISCESVTRYGIFIWFRFSFWPEYLIDSVVDFHQEAYYIWMLLSVILLAIDIPWLIQWQNRIEFKVESIIRIKVGHFILIKGTIYQEDVITGNLNVFNITVLKYIKQNPKESQREFYKSIQIFSRFVS